MKTKDVARIFVVIISVTLCILAIVTAVVVHKDRLRDASSENSTPGNSSVLESSDISSLNSVEQTSSETESEESPKPIVIPGLSNEIIDQISELDNTKDGWGQGLNKDSLNRPTGSINAQNKYGKYNARFIMENEQKVYLTFDEGYENGYTSNILDTLKEKNVKAVFFVTLSYAKKNPTLIRRMIDEGHIVGNHSYKHYSYPEDTIQAAYDDLISLHKYMVDEYNYEMKLFRFPMGQYSERMLCLLDELGYESVFWSYAYADWDTENQPEPSVAKEKIVSNVHPGALYLLHAVSKTNTEVLAEVIDDIRALGYTFEEYPVS